jgi:hypothetical protein
VEDFWVVWDLVWVWTLDLGVGFGFWEWVLGDLLGRILVFWGGFGIVFGKIFSKLFVDFAVSV